MSLTDDIIEEVEYEAFFGQRYKKDTEIGKE